MLNGSFMSTYFEDLGYQRITHGFSILIQPYRTQTTLNNFTNFIVFQITKGIPFLQLIRNRTHIINASCLMAINQRLHLLYSLWSRSQVLIARLSNQDIILNPHASDLPILLQHLFVDILSVFRILEIWLDDEFAEVDLGMLVACNKR